MGCLLANCAEMQQHLLCCLEHDFGNQNKGEERYGGKLEKSYLKVPEWTPERKGEFQA